MQVPRSVTSLTRAKRFTDRCASDEKRAANRLYRHQLANLVRLIEADPARYDTETWQVRLYTSRDYI